MPLLNWKIKGEIFFPRRFKFIEKQPCPQILPLGKQFPSEPIECYFSFCSFSRGCNNQTWPSIPPTSAPNTSITCTVSERPCFPALDFSASGTQHSCKCPRSFTCRGTHSLSARSSVLHYTNFPKFFYQWFSEQK